MDFTIKLEQLLLDAERILALVRTRGYDLARVELLPPALCHLSVRGGAAELKLLRVRLERLPGVTVETVRLAPE